MQASTFENDVSAVVDINSFFAKKKQPRWVLNFDPQIIRF